MQRFLKLDKDLTTNIQKAFAAMPMLKRPLSWIAHTADWWLWTFLPLLIGLVHRPIHKQVVIFSIGIFTLAVLISGIKWITRRARPQSTAETPLRIEAHSFPSGHAARVFFIALCAWLAGFSLAAFILLVWAVVVCLSRISTGHHYLSDVAAGILIGLIFAILFWNIAPQILELF